MRHRNTVKTFGRPKAAREAMLKQLATSVVLYDGVKTTLTKAKAVKPIVEKAITRGKVDSIHTRRELMKVLQTQGAVNKVLEVYGPKYKDRNGGYTRITKLGTRQGDGAPMAKISFV